MFPLFFATFITYSVCTPTARIGQGNIWFYPIYDSTNYKVLFVIGTWLLVYVVLHLSAEFLNEDPDEIDKVCFVD